MRITRNEFSIAWHNETQNVLLWHFPQVYIVEELLAATEALRAYVEHSGKTRLDLVVVMDKTPLDERGGVLLAFAGVFWPISVRARRIVCVAASPINEVTLRVLRGTSPNAHEKVAVVPHLDEAFEIINEERGLRVS